MGKDSPGIKFASTYFSTKIGKMHWILWIFLCFFTGVTIEDCPNVCECKWKGGKQTAVCIQSGLNRIPDLDPDTQVLDVSGNRLSRLTENIFLEMDLINLQKIYMNNCGLLTVDAGAFSKLTNLVELDLSSNLLNFVPSISFREIGELRDLKLNSNPISRLTNDAFLYLPKLTKLELTDCRIGTIEMSAFRGLSSLEWLRLDNNNLISVQPSLFYNLANLHGLGLSGNPWNCTCSIRDLVDWMHRNNVPFGIPLPSCNIPEKLKGISWDTLELEDFACIPTKISNPTLTASSIDNSLNNINNNNKGQPTGIVTSYENEITLDDSRISTIYVGENATLECKVKATPDTKVGWHYGKSSNELIVNGSTTRSGNNQLAKQHQQQNGDWNPIYIVTESFHIIDGADEDQIPISSEESETSKSKVGGGVGGSKYANVSRSLGYKVSRLEIIHATQKESGSYVCNAESRAGSLNINFTLSVLTERNLLFKTSDGIFTGSVLASVALLCICLILICILIAAKGTKRASNSRNRQQSNANGDNSGANATRVVLLMNKEEAENPEVFETEGQGGNQGQNDKKTGGGRGGSLELNHFPNPSNSNNNPQNNFNYPTNQPPPLYPDNRFAVQNPNFAGINANYNGFYYNNGYYNQIPPQPFDSSYSGGGGEELRYGPPPQVYQHPSHRPISAPKPDLIDDNPRFNQPVLQNEYFYGNYPIGEHYYPPPPSSSYATSGSSGSNLYSICTNTEPRLMPLPNQIDRSKIECPLLVQQNPVEPQYGMTTTIIPKSILKSSTRLTDAPSQDESSSSAGGGGAESNKKSINYISINSDKR